MSGIYFHIPFCKRKCNYCDFYSIRDSKGIDELVSSEISELSLRKDYLGNELIETIYFGGGTPSILGLNHISAILEGTRGIYNISPDCEVTFEANPDDLSDTYIQGLYDAGINRLSIGIQSFNDEVLKFLGRRHDSSLLHHIITEAQRVGFTNISVDLIFGIPGFDYQTYIDSLNEVLKAGIQHISAYALSIEKGTYFNRLLVNHTISEIGEEEMLRQFNATIDILADHGYQQYEISNYAIDGYRSRHNSSYWESINYLGIGPSAHSYNQVSRQWNVSDTRKYCTQIKEGNSWFEIEQLTVKDKFNEYIMIGLRTSKGISGKYITDHFDEAIHRHFIRKTDKMITDGLMIRVDDQFILNRKGVLISDYLIRLLYYE